MKVPKLPFLEKKGKSEYFLSLVLRDEKASAVVFHEVNGRINVVGEHSEPFKNAIEDSTEEELLEVIDKAVSTAEKNLPPDVESHKTIFGVKQDWITDGKINKDYLAKLKKISDELEFQPMGFLVIPEAIAHLLQKEEGAPISAVLVEVGQKSITLSLIKTGKIVETKTGPIEGSISKTTELLLKHFQTSEILPSRIILFDGGKEELQQEFISHKWDKTLAFLHVPQVNALPANFDARAVLNGAASQMGFEILEASLSKAERDDKEPPIDALDAAVETTADKTLAEAAQEFGFVGTDVKSKEKIETAEPISEEKVKPTEELPPKTAVSEELKTDNLAAATQFREVPEEVKLQTTDKKQLPVNAAMLTNTIRGFAGKIKIGSLLRGANNSRKKLLIGIVPLAILLLILYFYLFMRSAVITLDINSKEVQKSENVTFSQSDPTDAGSNVINAQFLSVSEDGKNSTSATGKKETGDKAKGTVTVFNSSTDGGVTLPTGTVITSSTDLKFLTDKAVTVASASGDIFSGTTPGKANISVTAEKFGTNYNLPSNTKFTVSGSSDIAAKNDNAFSGGTKKDVKVVAKADQDKLSSDLSKQLESDAKDDIKKKATGDSVVLPNFISESFDHKSYSKDVGDEANELSLTATISYEGVAYKKDDINTYAKDKLKDSDNKLTIDESSIDVSASGLKKSGDNASAKLSLKAGLIPAIDQKDLVNQIKGNSITDAKEKLSQLPQVEHVDIDLGFPIPLLPKILPLSAGKIKIVINKNG